MIPQTDENAIVEKVVAAIPQTDENAIADKVADAIPLVDYDLIASKVTEKIADDNISVNVAADEDSKYESIVEKLASKMSSGEFAYTDSIANGRQSGESEAIDYDLIADKVALKALQIDYDLLADKVAEKVPGADYDQLIEKFAEKVPGADYELLAEKLAQKVPTVDYNDLAERVAAASRLMQDPVEFDYDTLANKVVNKVTETDKTVEGEEVNYEELAEKVAKKVPSVDYNELTALVKAMSVFAEKQPVDYDEIANKIVNKVTEAEKAGLDVNYDVLAEKLAEKVPAVNYDELASRLKTMSVFTAQTPINYDELALHLKTMSVFTPQTSVNYDVLAEKLAQKVPAINYDELALHLKTMSVFTPQTPVNYDVLAEKLAQKVPAINYDELALHLKTMPVFTAQTSINYDELASRLKTMSLFTPQTSIDYDELASRLKTMSVFAQQTPIDYDAIANRVVVKVAEYNKTNETINYDLLAEKLAQRVPAINYDDLAWHFKRLSVFTPQTPIDYDEIANKVVNKVADSKRTHESFDYDLLSEKIARKVPAINYDELASHLKAMSVFAPQNPIDYDELAKHVKVAASDVSMAQAINYDLLAEKIAQKVPAINYDELATHLKSMAVFAAQKPIDYDELAEHMNMKFTASDIPTPEMSVDYDLLAEVLAQKVPTVDYDEIAERVKSAVGDIPVSGGKVDYDTLAERVSMVMPEVDYDTIAERVAAVIGGVDEEAIANRISAAMPVTDENVIAEKIAGSISMPSINYDLIADRVARMLENEFDVTVDDSGISKIARTVSDELDYSRVAELVVEFLKKEEFVSKSTPVQVVVERESKVVEEEAAIAAVPQQQYVPAYSYGPQPAYNYGPQPQFPPQPNYNFGVQQPAPQQPQPAPKFPFGNAQKSKAVPKAVVPSAKPAPISDEEEDEEELETTRYKRSFLARIIQSGDETKAYYGRLKNAILQYTRTNSQVNWSNDRFSFRGETIAKIGVNGKTLCMYIALNPEEFSTSVYHQKYEGDKKMYEKTPMMVKIKSEVGLKRALRLIPLLMERLGAVEGEKKNVDYVALYPFKTDDELLSEGLIKLVTPSKTGMSF